MFMMIMRRSWRNSRFQGSYSLTPGSKKCGNQETYTISRWSIHITSRECIQRRKEENVSSLLLLLLLSSQVLLLVSCQSLNQCFLLPKLRCHSPVLADSCVLYRPLFKKSPERLQDKLSLFFLSESCSLPLLLPSSQGNARFS